MIDREGVKIIRLIYNDARLRNILISFNFKLLFTLCLCEYAPTDVLLIFIYMWYMDVIAKTVTQNTTLCGGSLGSRVDEERSKVRELM